MDYEFCVVSDLFLTQTYTLRRESLCVITWLLCQSKLTFYEVPLADSPVTLE